MRLEKLTTMTKRASLHGATGSRTVDKEKGNSLYRCSTGVVGVKEKNDGTFVDCNGDRYALVVWGIFAVAGANQIM